MKLNYLLRLWISLVLTTSVAWGQTFTPLRQVVRRPVSQVSNEARLTVSGNYLYFVGRDDTTGVEVWRTDGTPAGTRLLKDVVPGPQPTGTGVQGMIDVQGTLYFMANDARELWKTDGTESGTVLVRAFSDIVAGLMAYNNLLIFSPPGGGLWRTDGTPAGTFQLASRFTRGRGSMVVFQGSLYFYASSGPNFQETSLLKTDGSEGGTTLVKQLPGTMQSIGAGVDGVYFTVYDSGTYSGLTPQGSAWKSDGTPAGTNQMGPTTTTSASLPGYFNAFGSLYSRDLESGVPVVKRQNSSSGAFEVVVPVPNLDVLRFGFSTLYQGQPYGPANLPGFGGELSRLDGTPVRDIQPGLANGSDFTRPAVVGDRLYFSADDGTTGFEIWQTDATSGNTRLAGDLLPGAVGSIPQNLTVYRNELYFDTRDGTLWKMSPGATSAPTPSGDALAFQIVSYDCNSGVLQYQLTGGNGSDIFLNLPGVIAQSIAANTILTYTFPGDGRQGRTVTGSATQSGQVLPITFTNGCGPVTVNTASVPVSTYAVGDILGASARVSSGTRLADITPTEEGKPVTYPNPAEDVLTMNLDRLLPAQPRFTLTDVLGRTYEVESYLNVLNERSIKLSVGHLVSGLYVLRIGGEGFRPRVVRFLKR